MANFIGLSNDKTQRINKRWNCQNSFKGNENCVFSRFERGGTIRYSLYKETSESLNEKEDMKKIVKVAMKKLYNWVFFNGFWQSCLQFPLSVSTRWRPQWFPCQPCCRFLHKGKIGEPMNKKIYPLLSINIIPSKNSISCTGLQHGVDFFRFTAQWWTPRRRWCGLATIRTARSWTEDLSGDFFYLFILFIHLSWTEDLSLFCFLFCFSTLGYDHERRT